MKQKDIITLVIAVVVMAVSVYFIYTLLFPAQKTTQSQTQTKANTVKVPAAIDEKTFTTVSTLSDYGAPAASGAGKADLFADY